MNIQELEQKHSEVIGESDLHYPEYLLPSEDNIADAYEEEEALVAKEATRVSIEFAIELLGNIVTQNEDDLDRGKGKYILQEEITKLTQYLNERSSI